MELFFETAAYPIFILSRYIFAFDIPHRHNNINLQGKIHRISLFSSNSDIRWIGDDRRIFTNPTRSSSAFRAINNQFH